MRSNLFLHFLNRDSREIFGLFKFHTDPIHISLLKRALNAAILLCEDHCVIPPGFLVEDEIAFELAEVNEAFLKEKRVRLPMRETQLTDYAEKKRVEYRPMRDRYSGLFSDRRIAFLGQNALGIIPRKSRIGDEIVQKWEAAADTKGRLWSDVRELISPPSLEIVRRIPGRLALDNTALTWSAIEPELPAAALAAAGPLRDSLQHVYFTQYCREFNLRVMSELPFRSHEFLLPTDGNAYNYAYFNTFLQKYRLSALLLQGSANTICRIKESRGWIELADAYTGLCRVTRSRAALELLSDRARVKSHFDWSSFGDRHQPLLTEPEGLALTELDGALSELANILTSTHGLPVRPVQASTIGTTQKTARRPEVITLPDLVLYVALREEFEVINKLLDLKTQSQGPIAEGSIGGVSVAVLSGGTMGRVPAAVEVAKYLESRTQRKPKLILIVGLAGGFEAQGTSRGHVICGTTVVDLASRKIVPDENNQTKARFRRRDFVLTPALQRVLQGEFDLNGWRDEAIEHADWPDDRRPSLHYGLVASVDEVVAEPNWAKSLQDSTEKLLGVEMEAGGVCAAAEVYGVPVCMLRAVSDNADPAKADDDWRTRGMKTVAVLVNRIDFSKVFAALRQ